MLKNYIKVAFKTFGRHKLFTFISLFGISFTLYACILLVSLYENSFGPVAPESEQSRILWVSDAEVEDENSDMFAKGGVLSPWFYTKFVKSLKNIQTASFYSFHMPRDFYLGNEKIELDVMYTDSEYWNIYDFTLITGDFYNQADMDSRLPYAVVTAHTAEILTGSTDAIGKIIEMDGDYFEIKGVIKDVSNFRFNTYSQIWLPLTILGEDLYEPRVITDFNRGVFFNGAVLLDSRFDKSKVQSEFQTRISSLSAPGGEAANEGKLTVKAILASPAAIIGYSIFSLQKGSGVLFYTLAIGGIILFMLLPAINLANINMSRIMERQVEIGIRKAFGASSTVLTGQFLIENIILTALGALIGFLGALITIYIINEIELFQFTTIKLNGMIFFYTVLLMLIFGFLSGVAPATVMAKKDPAFCLQGGEK